MRFGANDYAAQMTMTRSEKLSGKPAVRFIPGTAADSYAVFLVFEQAYADLMRRQGEAGSTSIADRESLARMWASRRPLYEHLANTADQFWLARRGDEILGFARSILRDDLRLLTEFFIVPGDQSTGLGRELLTRAFPAKGGERRWLLATSDLRAQALYLKNGLYPSFPAYYLWREPRKLPAIEDARDEDVRVEDDLTEDDLEIQAAAASPGTIEAMGDIDAQLLDHRRDVDHEWLMSDRQAHLYYRAGEAVGYGYTGPSSGPFALLNPADFPAVLAHAEGEMARLDVTHFGLEVPMVNHSAVDYLLGNGFRIGDFMATFMSNGPVAGLNHYIMTSPPFIL